MQEILSLLTLSSLPALANFAGGLLSEWLKPSKSFLNFALHAAAGIILAVVSVEVMPNALDMVPTLNLALAFIADGVLYLLNDAGIHHWQRNKLEGAGAKAWMVYVAVSADLIGDGLLIGSGSAVSGQLALLLALGQVLADVPEGISVLANFRDKGVKRSKRLRLSASFVFPAAGSAFLAYFLLRNQPSMVKFTAMVFVAGLYSLAAVVDMLGEPMKALLIPAGQQSAFYWDMHSFYLFQGVLD